jgi:hypothetical protein
MVASWIEEHAYENDLQDLSGDVIVQTPPEEQT